MLKLFVPLIALVCAPFLAGPTAYGQDHPDHPPLVTGPNGQIGIYGPNGRFIGIDDDPEAVLGGSFGNPFASFAPPSLVSFNSFGTILRYRIDASLIPGSSFSESFLVGIPRTIGTSPLPVLVLFHGFGEEPQDVVNKTNYFRMGMFRGWVVIAPLGAHRFNYGIEYSQLNTEAALEMLSVNIVPGFGGNVDIDRFYAVGFSMGGGGAANFAARHLNTLDGLRFAGVVIHSGSTSLPHTYWTDPAARAILMLPELFGGPPTNPLLAFDYLRVSSVDMGPDKWIDPTTDMVRNLCRVPTMSFLANEEPSQSLIDQTSGTHAHLTEALKDSGGSGPMLRLNKGANYNNHDWRNLPEGRVFKFLAPLSSQAPPYMELVTTLADRNGNWYCFEVSQTMPRTFSPFDWKIVSGSNALIVSNVANIAELNLPIPKSVSLDTSTTLTYYFQTGDGNSVDLILGEYPNEPQSVLRGFSPGNYSYDLGTSELTLHEPADKASTVKWTIIP